MTFVHNHPPSTVGRADEGAALQRRLMQDLERQWLDTWSAADQLQTKVAPAPQTQPRAEVLDPAQAASAAQSVSAPGTGMQAQAAPGGHEMTSSVQGPASSNPIESTTGRQPAAAPEVGSQLSPAAGKQAALSDVQAARFSETQDQPVAVSAPLVGSRDASGSAAQSDASSSQLPVLPIPGPLAASASLGSRAETSESALAATSPTPAAVGRAATLGMAAGATGTPANQDTAEHEAAAPPRQSFKQTSTEAELGPRHLMLRETSDESVLATMRDTELGGAQSQLAADGLARALMEAGYARVQVVVNGQQHRKDRGETAATTTDRPSATDPKPNTPTPLQERRNGR